ncbi:ABC transporter ATP-binding protein [Viridibacillus sp. FSL R5-0477]|uniref:ABC transporter ATP-binding protein n=2 Tax=Viridibacillus TaxID=496496 RepID=W4EPE1_9BACL|nr:MULTISPECIES: ABC transporter ATP-binding protein [Viridibacillus]ETT82099.1 ABC transporter ATP-binding protein [Viridibacillus arenosi FSL R5-213]KOO47902.1 ABC transporter ATP-binding protein [Viridibacillus arvi]OMC81330.1 ABC transporter ATP-binding protein [Viridibacillus sp. FSL H8-0123]OMC86754.1 ABC transporter ATP-binding protein [Viridibacillus sp. FSL H7-0596]OMC90374.1 ABC transporter ATP-binding protein [Viridibacillus arenosi]
MGTGKRLFQYALMYKKLLISGLLLLAIAVAADLAGPLVAKKIIDDHIAKAEVAGIDFQPIAILLAVFFGLAVVAAIFRYGQYLLLQMGANRIIQKMRNEVYEHIQTLPIRYFDNLPAGKVVARVTNDTEAIRDLFVTVVSQFAASFMTIFGIYIALFFLDWKMALIALFVIPILIVWTIVYRKYASKYNHIVRGKVSDMNGMINESINGMTIIQAFSREKQIEDEFAALNEEHYRYQNKLLILDAATSHNLVGVIRSLTFVLFIWYFGSAEMNGAAAISVGMLYAFVDYITRLFNPVTGIVNQLARLERANVAAERVFELLDQPGEPVVDKRIPRYKGNVRFEHVWFAYKEQEYVLKDIDFEAKQGETVALVGHTGSGKSSIMNLLFSFYDVSKGAITIDGINIKEHSRQTIREHMGIVLQDPYLFTGTIESNVSLGDPRITRDTVQKALDAVGGERVLKNLPKGLDEPVIEKGSTLSSGQRQLISFARALAFDPAILILDEATSNIDTETEEIIQHAMDVLKKGRTTFIIAHRLSTIKNADRILVLDRGEIVEQGTHDELLKQGGRYEQMYKLQSGEKNIS